MHIFFHPQQLTNLSCLKQATSYGLNHLYLPTWLASSLKRVARSRHIQDALSYCRNKNTEEKFPLLSLHPSQLPFLKQAVFFFKVAVKCTVRLYLPATEGNLDYNQQKWADDMIGFCTTMHNEVAALCVFQPQKGILTITNGNEQMTWLGLAQQCTMRLLLHYDGTLCLMITSYLHIYYMNVK